MPGLALCQSPAYELKQSCPQGWEERAKEVIVQCECTGNYARVHSTCACVQAVDLSLINLLPQHLYSCLQGTAPRDRA